MKKRYAAIVTMKDATHEWDVVVYNDYESIEQAADAIERMKQRYGDMVIGNRIE